MKCERKPLLKRYCICASILSLVLSLSLSCRTKALELTTEVYRVNDTGNGALCRFHYQPENYWGNYSSASSAPIGTNLDNREIDGLSCKQPNGNNLVVADGDYIEVFIKMTDIRPSGTTYFDEGWGGSFGNFVYWNNESRVLAFEEVGTTQDLSTRYTYWRYVFRSEGGTNPDLGIRFRTSGQYLDTVDIRVLNIGVYRTKTDSDYSSILSALNNNISSLNSKMEVQTQLLTQIRDGVGQTTDAINNLNLSIEQSTEGGYQAVVDKEKEELEDAQTETESSADDASNEAETKTQSLLATIGDIIEVFRSAQPTNCLITLNTGKFNAGTLDLCNAAPEMLATIRVILAIPITLAVLKVAYSIIMYYLTRIREEQE